MTPCAPRTILLYPSDRPLCSQGLRVLRTGSPPLPVLSARPLEAPASRQPPHSSRTGRGGPFPGATWLHLPVVGSCRVRVSSSCPRKDARSAAPAQPTWATSHCASPSCGMRLSPTCCRSSCSRDADRVRCSSARALAVVRLLQNHHEGGARSCAHAERAHARDAARSQIGIAVRCSERKLQVVTVLLLSLLLRVLSDDLSLSSPCSRNTLSKCWRT